MVLAPKWRGAAGGFEQRSEEELAVAVAASLPRWPWSESEASDWPRMASGPARGSSSSPPTEGQELHGLGMCAGTASSSREKREKTLGQAGWEPRSRTPAQPRAAGLRAVELTRRAHRPSAASSGSSGRTDGRTYSECQG